MIKHYPDTPKVLKCLWDNHIDVSVASRTGEVDGAEQLINLFGWNKYFTNKQIYPGSKDTHINRQVHTVFIDFMYICFFYLLTIQLLLFDNCSIWFYQDKQSVQSRFGRYVIF